MTTFLSLTNRTVRIVFVTVLSATFGGGLAEAQTAVNTGSIRLTAGADVPSIYYFRGIRQEADPKLTLWPYGDLGITLASDRRGRQKVAVNVGVWNSLHTGTAGSGKVNGYSTHYEEDFYSGITFGSSIAAMSARYIARTSPNRAFATIKEMDFQVTGVQAYSPYAVVAFELSDTGQADLGAHKGSYLELGARPRWPLGNMAFTVPLSVGLSLSNYYETATGDNKFGFFDVGGLLTLPLGGIPGKFGSWNVHGRVDYLRLGNGPMEIGVGTGTNKNKTVLLGGVGLAY